MKTSISDRELRKFEKAIQKAVTERMDKTMTQMKPLLSKAAEVLLNKIAGSPEFIALQTTLVGEFGFTPVEVQEITDIFPYLLPGANDITTIEIKVSGNQRFAVLHWADFEKLAKNPFAMHELTKFNRATRQFEVQQVVSWVDWLENGVIVRGFEFIDTMDAMQQHFSRSHAGLMRPAPGGLWEFKPTKIFERTGSSFDTTNLKQGFAALLRKIK